jgi:GNAT superfamily N-acetyltransferase
MARIRRLLAPSDENAEPYVLRPHAPGDIGWAIERHAVLYADEFGWDASFEGFVAEIAGQFLKNFDPARERCWIAERDGERIGCVFVVRETGDVARLRMLLVEPAARGTGLGKRLVDEGIRFAKGAGYTKLTLWTNDILVAARRIYEAAGFRLVAEGRHTSFGHDLVGQTWELDLLGIGPR